MTLDLPEVPQLGRQTPARGVLHRFESELGVLWPDVAPLCTRRYVKEGLAADSTPATPLDGRVPWHTVPADLQALLVGWGHYDENERAVLRGAVGFVTDGHRWSPDDDTVIEAAVRALLRGH